MLGPAILHAMYQDAIGLSVEASAAEMKVRAENIARLEEILGEYRNPPTG